MSFFAAFAAHYEAIFPFRPAVRDFLAARAGQAGARALDVGCGPGHYAGALAALGHAAAGLDLEPAMVTAAAARYPGAAFHVLDMRRLGDLPAVPGHGPPFELAFCIGNTASHLAAADWPPFLAALRQILVPGGRWVLQVVNWDFVLARGDHVFPPRAMPGPGGRALAFHRAFREVSAARARFETRLEEDGRVLWEGSETLHPLRAVDCQRLHAAAGFAPEALLADYDGRPFDPEREGALIYVGRAPA